jgi:hypothetical protein
MHDFDRVVLETPEGELEHEHEYGGQPAAQEYEGEYEGEWETLEYEGEGEYEAAETDELELATAFLEVANEGELDRFIGNLLRSAAGAVGDFARSKTGRQLGGILKQTARKALPVVGQGIGERIGGKAGARIGTTAGDIAARYFGLELEGLSAEDQEFELARQFVRFARAACSNAAQLANTAPPRQVAQRAVIAAARRHAPALLDDRILAAPPLRRPLPRSAAGAPARVIPAGGGGPGPGPRARSPMARGRPCANCGAPGAGGRWVRRGNTIVLLAE